MPSRNGSVFSSEEISLAAERQRNFEAAQYLHAARLLPQKIHGVSPESIAIPGFF